MKTGELLDGNSARETLGAAMSEREEWTRKFDCGEWTAGAGARKENGASVELKMESMRQLSMWEFSCQEFNSIRIDIHRVFESEGEGAFPRVVFATSINL